jgi:hypothetical protein
MENLQTIDLKTKSLQVVPGKPKLTKKTCCPIISLIQKSGEQIRHVVFFANVHRITFPKPTFLIKNFIKRYHYCLYNILTVYPYTLHYIISYIQYTSLSLSLVAFLHHQPELAVLHPRSSPIRPRRMRRGALLHFALRELHL